MKHLFYIVAVLMVAACGNPEEQIRNQYMGLCVDYRQSCVCQYEALRNTLDDQAFAELMGHLAALSDKRRDAGGTPATLTRMPGSPLVRQAYFGAVLACTRDAGF